MNRRQFLSLLSQYAVAASAARFVAAEMAGNSAIAGPALTSPDKILKKVNDARPLLGGEIPGEIAKRLGATHYDGKYCLTTEPYLLEGCRAIQKLGMNVAKLWFGRSLPGYHFNSDWKLPAEARLVDVAKHAYFQQAFALPFSTFILEIQPVSRRGSFDRRGEFAEDEQQFFELALHLLETYRDRDVTFILQHWEGDWMFRGRAGGEWKVPGPAQLQERADAFVRWLSARQNGVGRAREKAGQTRCRVYHAAEVNRVLDALKGIPTLATHVLPHVALDWISWSSYDGMGSAVSTWHGLEIIRHYARPAPGQTEPRIYVGEIGLPEQGRKESEIINFWDRAMGVFLAWQIPYIVHWELYCNEPADGTKKPEHRAFSADELRGFWLIRPDGSLSFSGQYLKALMEHAGGRLPESIRTKWPMKGSA